VTGEDPEFREYASPACLAHELDAAYRDAELVDADTRRDVMRWRKAERQRLYRERASISARERERAQRQIKAALDDLLGRQDCTCVAAYWPIRGEPDLRPWMAELSKAGFDVALPVVTGMERPLKFGRWRPGDRLARGRWGIAEPAAPEWVEPQLVIAPLLGVDAHRFRLGNGGGFFDRTLAAARPRPLAVGVGFGCARIETIYPLPHDIAMDEVVLGSTGDDEPGT
jgi:5,10-methenyltetrahydrofolate synthetase